MGEKYVQEEFLGEESLGEKYSLCKKYMGEKYVQEEFLGEESLGEKSVQEEFLGEESLCEKYMGEMYVQEEFLGEESLGEKIPFGITLSKMGDPGVPLNFFFNFRQNLAMFFSRGMGLSFYSDPRGAGGF